MFIDRYETALSCVFKKLNESGYTKRNIVFIALQGSQNYNLDVYTEKYESDFDWKVFVLPTFKDLYYNTRVSKTLLYEYGQIEVKDVRLFIELLSKMNSTYLELLVTPYVYYGREDGFVPNPIKKFNADELVAERKYLLIKSLMGMCLEKQHALCHEYEGLKDKLEKFGGYDPKQLMHALRIKYMLYSLVKENKNYSDSLMFYGTERDEMLDIKINGVGSKEKAEEMMEDYVTTCCSYYNEFIAENGIEVKLDKLKEFEDMIFNYAQIYSV